MKARQKEILKALRELGGVATTRAIAERTGFNVNGVSQTLGALPGYVVFLDGKKGSARWQLK
jgi:hypothetical protein